MALEGVTSDILDSVKVVLKDKIAELISVLLKELTPELLNLARDFIENYVIENDFVCLAVQNSLISFKEEVSSFNKKFSRIINEQLDMREDAYWKYARSERLLGLYNECINSEPCYIPREFRKDKFHVMSKEELDIVKKMELKEIQLQCEILSCRRDEFSKRCIDIEKEVENIVHQSNMSEKATKNRIARWHSLVMQDITKAEKKWDIKIDGMRAAYEKDKTTLLENQEKRLKTTHSTKSTIPSDFFRVTSKDIANTSDKTEADIRDLSENNSTSNTKINGTEEE